MSALDALWAFAESRSPDAALILGGLTYGDAREIVAEVARLREALDVVETLQGPGL